MYVQGLLLQRSSKSDVLPLPVELTVLVLSKLGVTMLQFGITLDGECHPSPGMCCVLKQTQSACPTR